MRLLLLRFVRGEFAFLFGLAVFVIGIWAFLGIADEVMEGDTHALDEAILLSMRVAGDPANPAGPAWLEEAARDITALGSTSILALVTVTTILFLLMMNKNGAALLVLVAVLGGSLLTNLLKLGFDRPRPDLVAHLMDTFTASFPSGHASGAAATYLTIGALLARVQPRRRIKMFLLLVAVAITLLVGVTRVYLGVHWPSDVAAGWAVGAAWAALVWLVAMWLQRRGHVEKETDEESGETPARLSR